VPEAVRDQMTFHLAADISEVLDVALADVDGAAADVGDPARAWPPDPASGQASVRRAHWPSSVVTWARSK